LILSAHDVHVELPRGWSGRLFGRPGGIATLHGANFALPLHDGEFGDRSTAAIDPGGAFFALTEYRTGPKLVAGSGLFAPSRIPMPLDPAGFAPERLAHARPGQVGSQHFFTVAGRPFCLYVVLAGGRLGRRRQLAELNHVLASVRIAARR
jgi:hypothetical protein